MPLVNKVKDDFSYVKTCRKTPPSVNYMPIKEIASLAGGGMFAAVGLIGSIVTTATSSVLPAIYEKVSFNKAMKRNLKLNNLQKNNQSHLFIKHKPAALILLRFYKLFLSLQTEVI